MLDIKPLSSLSMRSKIVLLLSLMFGLYLSFLLFNAYLDFPKAREDRQREFEWATRWIESEQQRHLAQARLLAMLVAQQLQAGIDPRLCARGMTGISGLDPEFGRFAIADPSGRVLCNALPGLPADVSGQGYFESARKLPGLGLSVGSGERMPAPYSAILGLNTGGKSPHVVLVGLDFSWVGEELRLTGLPATAHLMLVNEAGTLVAGSQNLAGKIGRSIAATPFYRHASTAGDTPYIGDGYDGEQSLVVTHAIRTGSGPMRVIIDTPYATLMRPVYLGLISNLLYSLLVYALLLALSYYWTDRFFLRKVRQIERTARRLASGDLGARVAPDYSCELGHLGTTLDGMAATLQTRNESLKAAEDELYRVNRALRVLSAGNKSLLFAKTEGELLQRICHDIVEEGGYLAAWIGFSGPEHDRYLRTAAAYSKSEDPSHQIDWNKAGNGLEPVINAVREDKVLVINDTEHESVHPHLGEQAARFGYRSVIVLPLRIEGKPLGALILCAYRPNEFSGVQVEYLKETASDTSFGIEMLRTKGENNRLALLGEHHELMLRNSLEDALRAISLTIEMRDPYTSGHQHRVAALARALAQELGLNEDETHGIYLAAIVHDIGKINVPAEILVKPSRLSETEYVLVKQHVTAGYEILKNIQFPWPIADMVHRHHERLDGSGYPHGLKDGDILFGGRILAVADVVEAISSHRPYRPSLGIKVALREIEKGRGTLYDAAVVDACLALFRERRFQY